MQANDFLCCLAIATVAGSKAAGRPVALGLLRNDQEYTNPAYCYTMGIQGFFQSNFSIFIRLAVCNVIFS